MADRPDAGREDRHVFPTDPEHYRTYHVERRLAEDRAAASADRLRHRYRGAGPFRTAAAHVLLWVAARLETRNGGSDLRRAA